ncbi:universal stress protein YxiE-like isoform X1 [Panicum virgatum]|nr:universal stress protein YxiE-like isoform X1 [Panicum virgatum]
MKVLVAVDDSDFSRHALAWVLDHLFFPSPAAADQPPAAEPRRPELVLVHALEPLRHVMYPVGPGSAVYGAPSMVESVRAAQAENARGLLDRAKRICHQRGVGRVTFLSFFFIVSAQVQITSACLQVSAEAVVVEGEPREALCRAAADMGAGLLVVGSRGLGAIKRAFLGSVSDYCAHHASCPIIVVKPPRDDGHCAHRAAS